MWTPIADPFDRPKEADFNEIRFWVKSDNIRAIGVRISDATEQLHQKNGIVLKATDDWQEVSLKIADVVGGEHRGWRQ